MALMLSDVECYNNYFLLLCRNMITGQLHRWEKFNDVEKGPYSHQQMAELFMKNTIVGFNWQGYDEMICNAYFSGYTNAEMYEVSKFIIEGDKMNRYRVYDDYSMDRIPYQSIDIMPVAPLMASLKVYAGRVGHASLQDLPVPPDTTIVQELRDELLPYCANDLGSTDAVFVELKEQLKLRQKMSAEYGLMLMSKSDAQIAEAVIRKKLTEKGVDARPKRRSGRGTYTYDSPEWMTFETEEMRAVHKAVTDAKFAIGADNKFKIPAELRKAIEFKGKKYKMGVGGLHSQESNRSIIPGKGEKLFDIDVTSYYPSIILTNGYTPETLGQDFLDVYRDIVETRIAAKNSGDKVTADSLKIVINSSFGKFGNQYSTLFSPKLLMQTTLTGQLALLLLIELMETSGVEVVSANTDGIIVHTKNEEQEEAFKVAWAMWESTTGMTLEDTEYVALHNESVNTYFAVTPDGKAKGKGVYGAPGLTKTPHADICAEAVKKYCIDGVPVEQTIRESEDIKKFVFLRKVGGGALWKDELVGSTCRWYVGRKRGSKLYYYKTGNSVPFSDSAILVNKLPRDFPTDNIDYDWYISRAESMLSNLGMDI